MWIGNKTFKKEVKSIKDDFDCKINGLQSRIWELENPCKFNITDKVILLKNGNDPYTYFEDKELVILDKNVRNLNFYSLKSWYYKAYCKEIDEFMWIEEGCLIKEK